MFSDHDFDTLDEWLSRRPAGLLDIVELEGFLTAIVIGPNLLMPNIWLPKVWGGKSPRFRDLDEMNRFTALVMNFYNEIAECFAGAPDRFEPTFYERKVGRKTYLIVDEWCTGFMKATRLDAAAWKPLKRDRPELLKPIELFGTRAGYRELDAGGAAAMHTKWSPRIAPAVRKIHAYWRAPRSEPTIEARSHSKRTH